jgi:DNA replication protein DnaC
MLTQTDAGNRLDERLKPYTRPKRLIIEEIGDIPMAQHGAHLFFQLISRRCEREQLFLDQRRDELDREKRIAARLLVHELRQWLGAVPRAV